MSMTDEKIIKALVRCGNIGLCKDCPYYHFNSKRGLGCHNNLMLDALDLIERQQAEIEQWKEEANKYQNMWCATTEDIQMAKAEAIREFAVRLKELSVYGTIREYSYANNMSYMLEDMVSEGIDNLVKEMTEKEGGKG